MRNFVKDYLKHTVPDPILAAAKNSAQQGRSALRYTIRESALQRTISRPIKPQAVLYESFSGNGALDSPHSIFLSLLNDPEFAHLHHYWVLTSSATLDFLTAYGKHPRVHLVRYRSREYIKLLHSAHWLVNNATFPSAWIKRPDQVYINTWHGTPLKKMGYNVEGDGRMDARNVMKNFLSADWLLSSSPFMTQEMYLSAYKLNNIFNGHILEEGFPRTDWGMSTDSRAILGRQLAKFGTYLDDRKIILFAPTWRGQSFYRPSTETDDILRTVRALFNALDPARYQVFLKVHQAVYTAMAKDQRISSYLIPNSIPTNVALGATDVLVSDYSSIFFDFLATRRPILFHAPDIEDYSDTRGLSVTPDELPGPVSTTLPELTAHLDEALRDHSVWNDRIEQARLKFCPHDDGRVTSRVIDAVFRGRVSDKRIVAAPRDGKKRILLYPGGMETNGITTSALSLLNCLDRSSHDITVLCHKPKTADAAANIAKISPEIRVLVRDPPYNWALLNRSLSLALSRQERELEASARTHRRWRRGRREVTDTLPELEDQDLWLNEWRRLLGDSTFDCSIDFSGYGPFLARILLAGNTPVKSIWLHNDLAADAERNVDNNYPHRRSLRAVFGLYPYFDNLVSVSDELAHINAENLRPWARGASFESVPNVIDAHRITELAEGTAPRPDSRVRPGPNDGQQPEFSISDAISRLLRGLDPTPPGNSTAPLRAVDVWPDRTSDSVIFATVGRLSPEKNQARLIRAFREVHEEGIDARLLVIGTGPLRDELESLSKTLGLSDSVVFTGKQSNPFALMAASDCFVLSSNYEGQPMVILEARVLGLPVVTTAFGSVEGSVPPGAGVVVPQDEHALAQAMIDFARRGMAVTPFDVDDYNRGALKRFDEVVFNGRPKASTVRTSLSQ